MPSDSRGDRRDARVELEPSDLSILRWCVEKAQPREFWHAFEDRQRELIADLDRLADLDAQVVAVPAAVLESRDRRVRELEHALERAHQWIGVAVADMPKDALDRVQEEFWATHTDAVDPQGGHSAGGPSASGDRREPPNPDSDAVLESARAEVERLRTAYDELTDKWTARALECNARRAEVEELREALDEAIGWAQRPSPIPMLPFNDFLERMGDLGCGPRKERKDKA